MVEEKKKEEKKVEQEIAVVNELPQQQVRIGIGEDGKEYNLMTRDEALTEILKTVKKLEGLL